MIVDFIVELVLDICSLLNTFEVSRAKMEIEFDAALV
jgi:hypothetical protein